jgi:hypothetical protein
MSDDMEQFERRLKNEPLQPAPAEWRREILSAANESLATNRQQRVARHSLLSSLNRHLVSLLWPHPMAWGGLAAVWVLILVAHVSLRNQMPAVAKKSSSPSPEVVAELQQQQHLLAELLGGNDMPVADRPKIFMPKPRSENLEILSA